MNQETTQPMTLGARMRAAASMAKMHPLEALRLHAEKEGGRALEHFKTAEALYARIQAGIAAAVEQGEVPKPFRLTFEEETALATSGWEQRNGAPHPKSTQYPLYARFVDWAQAEEIQFRWKYSWDNGGIHSWWDFVVLSPDEVDRLNSAGVKPLRHN